ncbi:MAG: ATP synthase F0 subunit B [Deltaproteobacteria bacterium]|nr:ATP synthase F0 subunit B [Deltaproteobacteria bacterium]
MIELNITFLYQIGGFFILYFVLNAVLYKPVLKKLEERDKNIAGAKREAEMLEVELQKRLLDYENQINDAKVKAQEDRLRLRQEGFDKEKEILENARKNYQDSLLQAKTKLKDEIKIAIISLKEECKLISKDVAEKMLERKVA